MHLSNSVTSSVVGSASFYSYFLDVEDQLQEKHGYTLDDSIAAVIEYEEDIARHCLLGKCVDEAACAICFDVTPRNKDKGST